jgi:hypothetical protein
MLQPSHPAMLVRLDEDHECASLTERLDLIATTRLANNGVRDCTISTDRDQTSIDLGEVSSGNSATHHLQFCPRALSPALV